MALPRKVCLDLVRRRLYQIVRQGSDKDAVNAARVLLREDPAAAETKGPDLSLLDEVAAALREEDP